MLTIILLCSNISNKTIHKYTLLKYFNKQVEYSQIDYLDINMNRTDIILILSFIKYYDLIHIPKNISQYIWCLYNTPNICKEYVIKCIMDTTKFRYINVFYMNIFTFNTSIIICHLYIYLSIICCNLKMLIMN